MALFYIENAVFAAFFNNLLCFAAKTEKHLLDFQCL